MHNDPITSVECSCWAIRLSARLIRSADIKWYLSGVGLALLLTAKVSFAADLLPQDLPRMWKVVTDAPHSPPTTFFLLAASHLGLRAEYGRYFDNVVIPAFDASDDWAYEGADSELQSRALGCPNDSSDLVGRDGLAQFHRKVANQLVKASHLAASASRSSQSDVASQALNDAGIRAMVDRTDGFDLLFPYMLSKAETETQGRRFTSNANNDERGVDVTVTLKARRPSLPVSNVDHDGGIRRAYCRAGSHRALFLEWFSGDVSGSTVPAGSANDFFVEQLRLQRGASVLPPELNQAMICDRSKEWVTQISAQHDGKTHFLVLGLSHFFDLADPEYGCPGVLTDLRNIGLEPELVVR